LAVEGNVPVEILNLGENKYVESSFINEKTHLLRNVIDKLIKHSSSSNDLRRLQLLLKKDQMKNSIPWL